MSAEFSVRVRTENGKAQVSAGKLVWPVGPSLTLGDTSPHPSALHCLLGAVSADLANGFRAIAEKRRIVVDSLEALAKARLENPLVALGVIGEEGSPACESLEITLFVSANVEASALEDVWKETLRRAPVAATLALTGRLNLQWRNI